MAFDTKMLLVSTAKVSGVEGIPVRVTFPWEVDIVFSPEVWGEPFKIYAADRRLIFGDQTPPCGAGYITNRGVQLSRLELLVDWFQQEHDLEVVLVKRPRSYKRLKRGDLYVRLEPMPKSPEEVN